MSQFSGKCDYRDSYEIFGEEYILNSKTFIGNNIIPLRMDSYKDLVPYFPYLVATSCGDKESAVIRLTNESFVDSEERETLQWYLDDIKKEWRRCKRKKIEFNVDEVSDKIGYDKEFIKILADEVARNGNKAEIPYNAHMPLRDYYRIELYKEMVKVGYSKFQSAEWCFGWERVWKNDIPTDIFLEVETEKQEKLNK